MNFINGTQNQKKLELMLVLFQDLQFSCRHHLHLQIDSQCGKIFYENFELSVENVVHYKNLTASFQQYFTENNIKILGNEVECNQIPNTYHYGKSTLWHTSRKYRITASICKSAVLFDEKLSPEASKIPLLNWLR